MDEIKMWIAISVMVIVMFAIGMCAAVQAPAREGWQGRPLVCDPTEMTLPEWQQCREWISNVQRPDYRGNSCCGEADAFEANAFEVSENGEYIAIITKEYPGTPIDDGEGGTVQSNPLPYGTRIVIPQQKVNSAILDGNPTGKGIVFLASNMKDVLCYFSPTLANRGGATRG